ANRATIALDNNELIKILAEIPGGSEQVEVMRKQMVKEEEEADKNKCVIS
ncbi:MAG: hypothetical protein Barrevirus1_69, partial [Barrevirus sp.]